MKGICRENELTTKDYWVELQGEINLKMDENEILYKWIVNQIKDFTPGTLFEIGCYPGRYLFPFAERNYKISGIDFLDNTASIGDGYRKKGYSVGRFYNGDFFNTQIEEKFDLVTSFGFIEHFKNFDAVIKLQADLVNNGGHIMIEVPNFLGAFQFIPRILFDYENFKKHNLKAMKPQVWCDILQSKGFQITNLEYLGNYKTWYESKNKGSVYMILRNFIESIFYQIVKRLNKKQSKLFSPYIVLIAKKSS